jgi:hypothetical protein
MAMILAIGCSFESDVDSDTDATESVDADATERIAKANRVNFIDAIVTDTRGDC